MGAALMVDHSSQNVYQGSNLARFLTCIFSQVEFLATCLMEIQLAFSTILLYEQKFRNKLLF